MSDEKISSFSKSDYSKHIKIMVEKAAFSMYMQKKEVHKKKLSDITVCRPTIYEQQEIWGKRS